MDLDKLLESKVTRKEFLLYLGGAVGALAITGWLAGPKLLEKINNLASGNKTTVEPELKDDLSVKPTGEGIAIYRKDVKDPVCMMNEIGGYVLEAMNGQNSFEHIAQAVYGRLDPGRTDKNKLAGSVAMFIAMLAEADFLKGPFYIDIVDRRESA